MSDSRGTFNLFIILACASPFDIEKIANYSQNFVYVIVFWNIVQNIHWKISEYMYLSRETCVDKIFWWSYWYKNEYIQIDFVRCLTATCNILYSCLFNGVMFCEFFLFSKSNRCKKSIKSNSQMYYIKAHIDEWINGVRQLRWYYNVSSYRFKLLTKNCWFFLFFNSAKDLLNWAYRFSFYRWYISL